ncbi:MAG: class I SAM-dependent methyltransferase [Tannerella sp.]|jgi:ubiquinone/menaquinone biosynthesis C-methylase UbiE|nr:class I SAM-dependent methyltransferase [Tannerella sp.]
MLFLRKLYYALTPKMRFIARRIRYFPVDLYDSFTGKRDAMTPPKGLIFIGSGDFVKQGEMLLDLLVRYAALKPDSSVLDIGCGIGRLAVPLAKYLSPAGSYHGFDIVKNGIDWCNAHIASKYPNFRFLHVDLKNTLYNDSTSAEARNFTFPYDDNSFDCIALTSVFTHMMPEDMENYLAEISRVMKPEGKCFATYFIVNEAISKKMSEGKTNFMFAHSFGTYYLMDKNVKEANVAFGEDYLVSSFKNHGLECQAIHYGEWSNSPGSFFFQDIAILKKSDIF